MNITQVTRMWCRIYLLFLVLHGFATSCLQAQVDVNPKVTGGSYLRFLGVDTVRGSLRYIMQFDKGPRDSQEPNKRIPRIFMLTTTRESIPGEEADSIITLLGGESIVCLYLHYIEGQLLRAPPIDSVLGTSYGAFRNLLAFHGLKLSEVSVISEREHSETSITSYDTNGLMALWFETSVEDYNLRFARWMRYCNVRSGDPMVRLVYLIKPGTPIDLALIRDLQR